MMENWLTSAHQLRRNYYRERLTILAWEERLSFQHFSENASRAPDVDGDVVLLPCQHDLGGTVVSRRNVSRHLGVLNTSQSKVANLQVAVLVHQDVGGFQIAMDDTCRVDVFQTTQNLIQEVLDELLLEWPTGEESVEVGAQELGNKVAANELYSSRSQ